MSRQITFAREVGTNKRVKLDLYSLIEEKMLVQASSGGGKSFEIRKITEEVVKDFLGEFQIILISPKREFESLREKFDFILVGRSREHFPVDIEANPKYAGKLCEKLLSINANAIIEFSGMAKERIEFVKNFIEFANTAPESLWHPVLFIIDEIHIFAPEKGYGDADSLGPISELASTGRDKGYSLIGATQRLAKFNKNVAAELNIKLIGKCSLDDDMKRASKELGFNNEKMQELRWLGNPNYHFYAFGPGLSDQIIKIKADKTITTHISGWKRIKAKAVPPTPKAIQSLLNQFNDIPQEAEKELKTLNDYKMQVNVLTNKIRKLESQQNVMTPEKLQKYQEEILVKAKMMTDRQKQVEVQRIKEQITKAIAMVNQVLRTGETLRQNSAKSLESIQGNLSYLKSTIENITPSKVEFTSPSITPLTLEQRTDRMVKQLSKPPTTVTPSEFSGELSLTEKNCLIAVAQLGEASRIQIAVLAKYSITSGGFGKGIGQLQAKGLIAQSSKDTKKFTITQAGKEAVGNYEPLPTDHETLLQTWKEKLGNQPGTILELLAKNAEGLTKEQVAEETGYSITSGGFGKAFSTLKKMELVTEENKIFKVTDALWPGMEITV